MLLRPGGNSVRETAEEGANACLRQLEAARFICAIRDNSGGQAARIMVDKGAFMNFVKAAFLKMRLLYSA